MSPTILCLAAVLTSEAAAQEWRPIYKPSEPLASAVRGQSPLGGGWYVPQQPGAPQLADNGPVLPGNQFVPPVEVGPTYITPAPVPEPAVFDGGAAYGYTTGIYAGYESVWVVPRFDTDASHETRFFGADHQTANQFDWDLEHSPRLWVGFTEPDGMGVQARYWQFDHGVETSAFDTPGLQHRVAFEHGFTDLLIATSDGETLFASHDLELHVIDLEKTWHKHYCDGSITVTGGVRYVRMDQDYEAKVSDGAGGFDKFIMSRHDFEGVGPTVSLFGRRRLWNSNFAGFVNARLSAVYGESSLSMAGTELNIPGNLGSWSTSGDDLMPITEFQVGTEWSCRICCDTRLFLRAALEGQVWFDAGTGMNTTNDDDNTTSPQIGNLGFFGFIVGGGLTY